jgi:hypothetical protein
MKITSLVLLASIIPSLSLAAGPGDSLLTGPGLGGPPMLEGAGSYGVAGVGDPCDRGTIFTALKVVRAYRDNEAFAFKHFEGKQLEISGRLVAVKRDRIVVNDVVEFEGFVALVTPDGKPPKPIGLEFRFTTAALRADPQLACDVAALWAGQFVTLRGACVGPVVEGDYVGVIFKDSQIAR